MNDYNTLGSAANGVIITDTLPSGFTFAATTTLSGGTRSPSTPTPAAGAEQPAWGTFSIAANSSLIITFTVDISVTAGQATYQNFVDVTSSNTAVVQFDPLNTTAEDVTVLLPVIRLTKSVTPTRESVGQPVTYTITAENIGDAVATGVAISDALPSDFSLLSTLFTEVSNGSRTSASNPGASATQPEWSAWTLNPGGVVTITFRVNSGTATGTFSNTVHADSASTTIPSLINTAPVTLTAPVLGTITGTVWDDLNGDGIWQSGEPGLGGVEITLSNGLTFTTDVNGIYTFTVAPGSYTLTETNPSGYTSTGDKDGAGNNLDTIAVTVVSNTTTSGNDFLDAKPITLTGAVFTDPAGNGTGTTGLPGVVITLTLGSGGTVTTTTDANGVYTFTNVMPGNHTLTETNPANYASTADTDGASNTLDVIAVTVISGTDVSGRNFWDQATNIASIGDLVWYDTDGNGAKEGGEVGIPGVVVSLTNSVGSVITTTTNASGVYTFSALVAGAYTVTVGSGTPVSATATSGADSKSSPYPISLTTGQVITNADFGYDLTPAYTLSKELITGNPARTREVVQFRITITNTGEGVIDVLPLADTYNEVLLRFVSATTAPDNSASDGTLNWADLTATLGDLAPGQAVSLTVSFEALRDTTGLPSGNAQNVATASGATVDPDGAGPLGSVESLLPTADAATVVIQGPTGVTLINTSVRPLAQTELGQVVVAWETLNELNVVGFDVYRTGPGEAMVKLTDLPLLAEKSGQAEGRAYSFMDVTAVNDAGYVYVLEILLADGQSELYRLGTVQWQQSIFLPLVVR